MGRPFSDLVVLQNAVQANGNGAAFNVSGMAMLAFQVSGVFSATVNFEATVDGQNWVALPAANLATGAVVTTTAAAGVFTTSVAGLQQVRARVSGYVSGAVAAVGYATSTGGALLAGAGAPDQAYFKAALSNQTADQSLRTNTAGKIAYVTNGIITGFNSTNGAAGLINITDGSGGELLIPLVIPPAGIGAALVTQNLSVASFSAPDNPLRAAVGLYVDITNTVTWSAVLWGVERAS